MVAALALRARCCKWHAHTEPRNQHAPCAVCDQPMPLVRVRIFGVAEHVCEACRPTIRRAIHEGVDRSIRRFLRGAPSAD